MANQIEDEKTNIRTNPKDVVQEVAQKARREAEKVVPTEQLVTFNLDREEYASIITDLREIIKIPEIVPVPGAPVFIKGIFNLRGQIIAVIDLEKRFSLDREHKIDPQHIIVAEVGDTAFGLMVDEVTGVLRVPVDSIRPVPALISSKIKTDYLKGVVVLENQESRNSGRESSENEKSSPKNKKVSEQKNKKTKKQDEKIGKSEQTGSRLILLLDVPKMLAERELLEFGSAIQETAKVNSNL
jgi:purine-binding chemotaxis protein CheW